MASSTTKTGRHDIAEILLKVVLNTINQIKINHMHCLLSIYNPISKTIIVKIQTRLISGDSLLVAKAANSSICTSGGYDTTGLNMSNSTSKHRVSLSGLEPVKNH